jgi:hypothetical protein
MSITPCPMPLPADALTAYWLGELAGHEEGVLEEHLIGCAYCSARLQALARLADGIRTATRAGMLLTVVAAPFIERMRDAGLHLRRYEVRPGGSVLCTVKPEDDAVVACLQAPLRGIERLDLEIHDSASNVSFRLEDIVFDPAASEVVVVPSLVELRKLPKTTQTMRLMAVAGGVDKEVYEYTFRHSPG